MLLHTRNGKLSVDQYTFLPALRNSEFKVEEDGFTAEVFTANGLAFLEAGTYHKVTANVEVTRYYKIRSGK